MFVFTGQNFKQLPLKTKAGLVLALVLGITLLVFFGLTFLVIALVGGIVTLVANLFRGPQSTPRQMNHPFPQRPPFQNPSPPRKYDDDDVIDV